MKKCKVWVGLKVGDSIPLDLQQSFGGHLGEHLTIRHYGEMMPDIGHEKILPEVIQVGHRIKEGLNVVGLTGVHVCITGIGNLWHPSRNGPVRSTLVLLIDDWKNHLTLIREALPIESKVRTYLPHISLTEDDPMGNTAFPRYVAPRKIVVPAEHLFVSIGGERIYCG